MRFVKGVLIFVGGHIASVLDEVLAPRLAFARAVRVEALLKEQLVRTGITKFLLHNQIL